jgi:hypothetical protein
MADPVYVSFADVPLDDDDPADYGDDAALSAAPWANPHHPEVRGDAAPAAVNLDRLAAVRHSKPRPAARIVPHPRDLRRGMVGRDVLALQRALSKAGLRRWGTFTTLFGPGTLDEVKTFQRRHRLAVDGVYGIATHRALAPFYDAWGIHLLNLVHVTTPAERRRATLLSAAMVLYNRRSIVHYTQGPARMWIVRNRLRTVARLAAMPYDYEDCSSSVTGLYYVAGLSDPNGLGYAGYGFTGTLAEHGYAIPAATAKVGALYFYGSGFPYHHVTMNVAPGRAFSHGSESGPSIINPVYPGLNHVRVYAGLP